MLLAAMNSPLRRPDIPVELRPGALAEWLEGVRYADCPRASSQLEYALRETNKQPLKPGARVELLRLYALRYLQLRNAHVVPDRRNAPQTLEEGRRNVHVLLRLVAEVIFGARLAVHEALSSNSRSDAHLGALQLQAQFLGEALMLYYHGYLQVPGHLWRELNGLFRYARYGHDGRRTDDLGYTLVVEACTRAAITALADPHRLAYARVWEVYELMRDWAGHVRVVQLSRVEEPSGRFVVDLKSSEPPVPYARFRFDLPVLEQYRVVDCAPLHSLLAERLHAADALPSAEGGRRARDLILHLAQAWSMPPRRTLPREPRSGLLTVAIGFELTHQYLAFGAFEAPQPGNELPGITVTTLPYAPEYWNFVNEGPGGFAVCNTTRPQASVRVGDIVALDGLERTSAPLQALAVIRWLMVQRNHTHMLGLQVLSRNPAAVQLHGLTESSRPPLKAFMVSEPEAGSTGCDLIVPPGRVALRDRFLMRSPGHGRALEIAQLLSATAHYESYRATWLA